jgi:outer membrane protein
LHLDAQNPPQKVGFVDVQKVIASFSQGKKFNTLDSQAQAALAPLKKQVTALQAKIQGGQATAQDQQNLNTAISTYQTALKKWQAKLNAAYAPVAKAIDKAVRAVAPQQGFSIIMNADIAASSHLVIYANSQSTDLTQAVISQVNK